jgi:Escherichia/Staphylococcus phage prohead protease
MSDWEPRTVSGLEIRQDAGGAPRLVGYAAVYHARSLDLGHFVETIRPGAFARTLREKRHDIRAFYGHDQNRILGRQSNGRLLLQDDARGLRVEILPPPDTQDGRDVITNVRNGNLDGMSFAFRLYDADQGQRWQWHETPPLREILEAEVLEVSVVAMPAYPDTSVAVRAYQRSRGVNVTDRLAAHQARARAWRS